MKKLNIVLSIIGFALIIIPFFICKYSIYRLVSTVLGLIIVSLVNIIYHKQLVLRIIFIPIILFTITYITDYFVMNIFNSYPIMAIKYTSSEKVRTYNSFIYRLYDCDNNLIVDNNYKLNYACSIDLLEPININDFLNNSLVYSVYAHKFVFIEGKINTIIGNSSLVLNSYTKEDNNINGYVTFNNNQKLIIDDLNIDITKLHIYDDIKIIGLVSSYQAKDSTTEIHLKDAIVIYSDVYDEYDLIVESNFNYEKVLILDNIYYYGINNIYYKYSEDNIYELSYLLNDKRETIDNIINNLEYITTDNENIVYFLNDFNLIKCSNDYIFVNKYAYNYDEICLKD